MIHRYRIRQALALAASDLLALTAAFLFAYWVRFVWQVVPVRDRPDDVPTVAAYLPVLLATLLVVPAVMASLRLYRVRRTNARLEGHIRAAGAVTAGMVLVAAAVSLFYRPEQLVPVVGADNSTEMMRVLRFNVSRLFLLLFWGAAIAFTVFGRVAIQAWVDHSRRAGRNVRRILIAGTGPLARTVIDKIRLHEEFGFRVVGLLGDGDEGYRGVPVLGTLRDAARLVREQGIEQLYVALPLSAHAEIMQLLRDVAYEIVEVKVVPDLLQYITLGAGVEDLDGVPIVNLSRIPLEGFPALVKRTLDVAVAAGCLLLFAPLFPLIALAGKLTSPGPVFYRQQRMGLDGRPFELLKFRSMVVDAEARTGPVWADEADARCTPIGAWLRKLSLDELPQFWNVLRGDMSLVGPRPERPYFVERFREHIPHYMLRHRVRAGMTGWAQVHGWRGNTSLEKRIEYDLYYIENWSLALDLKILWMTVTNGMVHEHAV